MGSETGVGKVKRKQLQRTGPQVLPAIDGVKMSKGRRSEIEGWADFLEQFLPWIALFDDRIPEELYRAIASEVTIKQSSLIRGRVCDLLEPSCT